MNGFKGNPRITKIWLTSKHNKYALEPDRVHDELSNLGFPPSKYGGTKNSWTSLPPDSWELLMKDIQNDGRFT